MRKTYISLSSEERDKIAVLRASGLSQNEIARVLGRNKGTISRELRRNCSPVYEVYLPHKAQERAERCKHQAGKRERLKNETIRKYVRVKLSLGWSPEQIAGRLSIDHPGLKISYEAIYQYIYDPEIKKQIDLVPCLVRSHKRRKRRGQSKKHRRSHIPNRVSIDQRPKHIESRKQLGHWETDTVISRQSKAALGVTAERMSRLVKIAKLEQKSALELRKALNRRLSQYPQYMRRTMTYDNGPENTEHDKINDTLGTKSYFSNPYHSWERGTVENTIGLIRRILPKKTNFAIITKEQIKSIEALLNNRPRKCLNYQTPSEVFKTKCCT